jgi:hypothetical protein
MVFGISYGELAAIMVVGAVAFGKQSSFKCDLALLHIISLFDMTMTLSFLIASL